jgi:uncharacterized protein
MEIRRITLRECALDDYLHGVTMPDIRDNTTRRRLEFDVDGHIAFIEYRRADGVLTLNHTEVPKPLAGRGIGSELARSALDWARAQGFKIVPRCPFIKAYIDKHAEYADLPSNR